MDTTWDFFMSKADTLIIMYFTKKDEYTNLLFFIFQRSLVVLDARYNR